MLVIINLIKRDNLSTIILVITHIYILHTFIIDTKAFVIKHEVIQNPQ